MAFTVQKRELTLENPFLYWKGLLVTFIGLLRALKFNLQRHARAIFNKRNNWHISLLSYMHDKTSIFNRKKWGGGGWGGEIEPE